MTDQNKKTEVTRLSVRYGLMIGAITIVLSIVFRIVDPLMQYTNLWVQLASGIIGIALLVVLGLEVRKRTGGYWGFGEAFKSLIIMSFVTALLTVLFSFVLFKFIDPALPTKISDASEAVITARLTKMGMDQDKIDQVTKTFESGEFKAKLEPTFKNEVSNLGFGMIFYAIIDLIIAACIKKNKPMFATDILENAIDPTKE